MARPDSHDDIPEHSRYRDLATFNVDQFSGDPDLLRAFADFQARARKHGTQENLSAGGHVTVRRNLTPAELDTELETLQRAWDHTDKRYREVALAQAEGPVGMKELKSKYATYEAYGLRNHALKEGYPIFDLIDKDDDVRAAALAQLGID